MGFPDGGVGDMSSMRAADLIWQLQSVVNSDLVAEDAKLDLVEDYGSDLTVSHHGKWSRLSSKSDHLRSAKIRQAFADALGKVTGRHVVESAGNATLDDIIGMLTANKKPLTKREVRKVLSNAGKFIDFGALRKALAADRKSCEKLPSQGNALMAKIGDFEKKVQRSKASFSKGEIDGFASKYAEAQRLRAGIANDYNAVFKAKTKVPLTHAEVMTALDGKKDADATGKPDDSLNLKTFKQLAKEKKLLAQELRKQPKDDPKAKETKARYRAVVGELRQILRARDQEAEKIEQSIPKEIRDQLAIKDDFLKEKARQERFANLVVVAFKDDLKGEKLTFDQAVELVNREKQKGGLSEDTAKKLEKLSTLAQKMELARSMPVREAIANGTEIKPDLDQFLKTEPDGEGVDSAVGGEAVKLRSELLTEIETLKTELGKWSASLKEANAEAGRLIDMDPGSGGRFYASDCENCRKSLQKQGDALNTLQKKLDDLQSRYDATFVAPKKAAEDEKRLEEVKKFQTQIDEANKDINGLRKQIDELKATQQKLTDAGGKVSDLPYDQAKSLVSDMKNLSESKKASFKSKRDLPSTDNDKELKELQKSFKELDKWIAENEKQIAEKWDGPINDLNRQIAEKEGQVNDLQRKQSDVKNGRVKEPEPKIIKEPEPKIIKEPEPKIIDKQEEKIIEKPKEEKIGGQDKPKVEVQKPIVAKLEDLVCGTKKLSAATIRDNVRKLLKESMPDFDQWVASLKDEFIKDLKLSDVSAEYFEEIWKDDLVVNNILEGQGRGSQDNIGEKVVEILKKHAQTAENNECQINPDEFKQELRQKLLARYQDSYQKEHWGQINAAQKNLTKLAEKDDFINNLNGKFEDWKKTALKPLCKCLPSDKFNLVAQKAAEAFKNFMEGIRKGKLLDVKDKTLFNHLIESLTPTKENGKPNVDSVLLFSLEQLVKGYGLVNGFDGTSKPKLQHVDRIKQQDGESPHEVIQRLLNQEPGKRKGLVQKGGYSCWMISIVNGLLNSERGRKVLGDCFAKKDEYVFPALDKDAKTKPITVKLDDVRKLLKDNPNAGISQLEAAIWLGVETMRKNPNIYSNTESCALGQMGEASEVATLFGLQGQSDENGKSSGDDSQIRWADGANALHGGQVVVLHRGPPGEVRTGHFMAVVGSQLDQNKDNAQSFDICDSLSAGITTNVGAGKLVTPFSVGSDMWLCNTVMVYDFPPAS